MKSKVSAIIISCIILIVVALTFIPREVFEPIITGKVITKVLVVTRLALNCTTYLYEGWNLVSMPCVNTTNERDFMLQTLNESYNSIHTYMITDRNDPWKSYNPNLPGWVVQDLTNITNIQGYWINMNQEDTWDFKGRLVWPAITEMYQGWNLVGFPSNRSMPINESLITIDGSYSVVYQYDANHSRWLVYYPNLPLWVTQNLTNMSLFYAYWINITQNDTWVLGS
jgi:hypothetical protein